MREKIEIAPGKKVFFASDMHLGLFPEHKSREREKIIIKWLDSIKAEAQVLFLLGDIFDFWHEYRKVAPLGFTRFIGKLGDLADSGIHIHYFTGNHDVWVYDYLPREIGCTLHRTHKEFEINNKTFYIGHGDGLSPQDIGYNILKAIFANKVLQFLFARIHPNLAVSFGHAWSKKSRLSKGIAEAFLGAEKEHQIVFAHKYLQTHDIDYFVFGHRHIPMDFKLSEKSRLINLGEWIGSNTYAFFNGQNLELTSFGTSANILKT